MKSSNLPKVLCWIAWYGASLLAGAILSTYYESQAFLAVILAAQILVFGSLLLVLNTVWQIVVRLTSSTKNKFSWRVLQLSGLLAISLVAFYMGVEWGAFRKEQAIERYVAKAVPQLEAFKSRNSVYPGKLPVSLEKTKPTKLRYNVDENEFTFSYNVAMAIMRFRVYSSHNRKWVTQF